MGFELLFEIVVQLIGFLLDVWLFGDAWRSRPSLVGESEMDRQARHYQWKLLLAIIGLLVLIGAAAHFYQRHFGH